MPGSVRGSSAVRRRDVAARVRAWLPLLVLVALTAAALGWRLGTRSLEDWDEAIYAQVAKEIVQSGDWFTLHWGVQAVLREAAVPHVGVTATLYTLFGVSELSARAASALSGVALVALLYGIGRRVYDRPTAFAAGIVLLTTHAFLTFARVGTTDMMLTMFLYLAAYAYVRLRVGDRRWWLVVGLATGLAVLTKSAAAVVAPAAVGLVALVDDSLPRVGTRRALLLETDLSLFQARYDVHVVGTAPPLVSAVIARRAGRDR